MENTVIILEELKELNPEKYFRDNLEVEEFEGLETLVRDSVGVISWEELIEEGVVKIEGNKIEGIYWKGDLDLRGTSIENLWKIKKVSGNLDCRRMRNLKDIGELEEVGGFFDLRGSLIKTLGKLKIVGGDLDYRWVETLEDIGELEYVGGKMYMNKVSFVCKEIFLQRMRNGKLKLKVEGDIIPYGDLSKIYENGELNYSRFRGKYGENINKIEDEEIKGMAIRILIIEYEIIKKEFIERGDKIKKESEGKKRGEEEKKNIRKKVMMLGIELKEIREKIEEFGVKVGDL